MARCNTVVYHCISVRLHDNYPSCHAEQNGQCYASYLVCGLKPSVIILSKILNHVHTYMYLPVLHRLIQHFRLTLLATQDRVMSQSLENSQR